MAPKPKYKYLRCLPVVTAVCLIIGPSALGTMRAHAQSENFEAFSPAQTPGRSGAMRAPLNIVPPAMQKVLGQKTRARKPAEKLAPRVAARQSKRAVRAVAAAPSSTGEIVQVGQLGALQDAPIGLEDGFGRDLWRGARLAFITDQMTRLPEQIEMAALRHAELTLHRSTTAAPVGTVDGTSWYAARLKRFLALGDTASVLKLESLTGGAAQDAYAAQMVALAHMGGGEPAAACALPRPVRGMRGHADSLSFFMQLLVYCQLSVGEFEKAGLTLQLNEKTLGDDKFFRELAFLMAAQAQPVFGTAAQAEAAKQAEQEPPLVVPSEVTPMQLALLQLAGHGLTGALEKLPPYFMVALAKDYAQPTATQLGAAHLAMRAGSLLPERFSQMSQLADLSSYQTGAGAAARTGEALTQEKTQDMAQDVSPRLRDDAPDAVFLADRLLKVDMATPEDQAMIMADALRDAQERGLWLDMVLVLQDRLQALASRSADSENGLSNTGAVTTSEPGDMAAASSGDNLPIIATGDMAVLLPAYLALSGEMQAEFFPGEPTETKKRLLAFAQINQPADPLGDLLAALPQDVSVYDDGAQPQSEVVVDPLSASATIAPIAAPFDNFSDNAAPLADAAALPADTRPHPIADWQAFEAQYEMASAALQRYLNRELAVYQGLGFEVPEAFRAAQSESDGDPRITKLADNKWIGDLLLGFVTQYAGMSAETMGEEDIIALLSYLRRAGLDATAQAVGAEILHHAAARLSVVAPQSLLAGNP